MTFARICVTINLEVDLVPKINLSADNVITEYDIEYEKIPKYCQYCRHIGHDIFACYIKNPSLKPAVFAPKKINLHGPRDAFKNNTRPEDGDNFITVGKSKNFNKSGSPNLNRDIQSVKFTSNSFDVLSSGQEPDADNRGGAGLDIGNVNQGNRQASLVGNNGTSNPDSSRAIEDLTFDLDTGGIVTIFVPPVTNHECSTSSDNLFDVQVFEDQQHEGADLAQEQTKDARDTISESNDDLDVDTGGGSDRSVHSANSPKKHSFSEDGEIGDNYFLKRNA
ncbi:hypothetical protein OROMI_006200 [Orobanche minor]